MRWGEYANADDAISASFEVSISTMTSGAILFLISFVFALSTTVYARSVLIICSPQCGCMTDKAQSLNCTNIDRNALVIFNARKVRSSYVGLSSVTVDPFVMADSVTPEGMVLNQKSLRCISPQPLMHRRINTPRRKYVVCTDVRGSFKHSRTEPRSSVSKLENERTKRVKMTVSPVLDKVLRRLRCDNEEEAELQIARSFGSRVFCLARAIA